MRKEYLPYQDHAELFTRPLGHDIYSAIVEEFTRTVKSLTLEKLHNLHLTPELARTQAQENLEQALKTGLIGSTVFPKGPQNKPFILIGGHWAASACCTLSLIPDLARNRLQCQEVCFSVPHTYALLLFAKGDRAYRDAMRAMAKEKESDGRKPLTWDLFEYKGQIAQPFSEDQDDRISK